MTGLRRLDHQHQTTNSDSLVQAVYTDKSSSESKCQMQAPCRPVLIDNLLQNLSACVAIQTGILYYLDNATAILLLRMIVQISFVTRTPLAPSNPQIAPVVLTTLFCVLYHIFISSFNPENGHPAEYSHGSILVDFVGGGGPVSRWRLVFIDCLILLIQLATLAIIFEYGKLQNRKGERGQELENEEQGTRRSQERQDVELHDLNQGIDEETATGSHSSDPFYTDYTVIDLDIVTSLRELARTTRTSSAIDPENGAVSSALSSVMAGMIYRP